MTQTDQLFIGIDSGTQGIKVIVFSRAQGRIVAAGQAPLTLIENPRGGREQDPADWCAACRTALKAALAHTAVDRRQVKAMAVSGQQHGLVPLDGQGQVIRPAKLWCDTETAPQCRTLTARIGGPQAVLAAIGNPIAAGFTASKLLWLKEQEPANYARLQTVLLPHDYLNFWLTGERRTEFGDASGTAYFDVRRRCWSTRVLEAIDPGGRLSSCLPAFAAAHEPCGTLRASLAREWGLPEDVVVAIGGGDNMMAAIGTGNVVEGVVTASLGTSGTIYAFSASPVVDAQGELAAFCSSSGGWLPLVCTMNVTVASEQIRRLFGFDLAELNRRAAQAPPGSGGLLLLPFFNGERTPALPTATATLGGMTALNTRPENFCRAAMEGATLGLRYGLDILKRNGIAPGEVRLVGGAARSAVWRRIVCDIFQTPAVSPASTEAGALGAALQALWCYANLREGPTTIQAICDAHVVLDPSSRVEPDARHSKIYDEVYDRYLKLEQALRPVYAVD
jgi:xylulokinase